MAAQRQDAAAGTADVAQQQLITATERMIWHALDCWV